MTARHMPEWNPFKRAYVARRLAGRPRCPEIQRQPDATSSPWSVADLLGPDHGGADAGGCLVRSLPRWVPGTGPGAGAGGRGHGGFNHVRQGAPAWAA